MICEQAEINVAGSYDGKFSSVWNGEVYKNHEYENIQKSPKISSCGNFEKNFQ